MAGLSKAKVASSSLSTQNPSSSHPPLQKYFLPSIPVVFRSDFLSPLLVFLPISVTPYYLLKSLSSETLDSYSTFLFVSSLLGLVPMASRLGWVTEQIGEILRVASKDGQHL